MNLSHQIRRFRSIRPLQSDLIDEFPTVHIKQSNIVKVNEKMSN